MFDCSRKKMNHVEQHYNKIAHSNRPFQTAYLRALNNSVKFKAINTILQKLEAHEKPITVIDLACGRGGDIVKFLKNVCVKRYLGVDISKTSIDEAKNRYGTHMNGCKISLAICNLQQSFPPSRPSSVDFVFCAFAIHYFFSNTIFQRVSRCLRGGGTFLFLKINKERLVEMDGHSTKNLRIRVINEKSYDFFLRGSVDCTEHFVVDSEIFEYAENNSFEVKQICSFVVFFSTRGGCPQFYAEKIQRFINKTSHGNIEEQNQIFSLYDVVILEKKLISLNK